MSVGVFVYFCRNNSMKRILIVTAGFILMTLTFSGCEPDNCKVCQENTYVNNQLDQEGSPVQYCGADLTAVESTPDLVNGNQVTKWECR